MTMKKYFEFKDDKSSKFWEISMEEGSKSFSVRFGKIGTNGSDSAKDFESSDKALKEAEKLIAEKTKKGYVESGAEKTSTPTVNYKDEWNSIVGGPDLKASLVKHFKFMATSKESMEILEELMASAEGAQIEGEMLVISFGEDWTMKCYPPSSVKPAKEVPKSYAEIIKVHSRIDLEGYDVPMTFIGLDDDGKLYPSEMIEEAEDFMELLEEKELDSDSVFLALYNHQDEVIFNPLKKSKAKEPAVCHLRHDDCEVSPPISKDLNFAEIYLRLLAEDILDQEFFEDDDED
jgi:predicted DNA-binding WGR domain protein